MPSKIEAVHILVKGRVQGVGYRFFAQECAEAQDLKGWVRNVPNGDVECEVEGPRAAIERFLEELRHGPPMARVEDLQIQWLPAASQHADFQIR